MGLRGFVKGRAGQVFGLVLIGFIKNCNLLSAFHYRIYIRYHLPILFELYMIS